ncbi:unnamed protein product [Lepidochelys olivacea]
MMESQNRKRAPAWTEREVWDLIAVWGEESVLSEFRSSFRNAKTFVKIFQGMKDRGHNRDPKQCCVKLKELRQANQKTREANGRSGSEPQTCRFYDELHAILGGSATTTPAVLFDSFNGDGGNTEAGFGDEEDDDDDEVVDSSQQASGETSFPDSQELFLTLDLEPVPPEPTHGCLLDPAGREGTSEGTVHEATGIFPCAFVKIIQDLPPEEGTINWLRCYYQDDAVGSIRDISVEKDLSSTPLFKHLMALMRIHEFLESKEKKEKDLENPEWIIKLALLTDITCHLNALNLQLQGKQKLPSNMLRFVTAFQNKITTLFIPDTQFVHFPKLRAVTSENPELLKHFNYNSFVQVVGELRVELESRFKDVMEYKEFFHLIENPFHVSVTSLSPVIIDICSDCAKLGSEIVELQTNDNMKSEFKTGVYHFWNMVPDTQYPSLKHRVQKMLSFFVCMYTCKSTFSTMNIMKRKQGNKLTTEHLDCLTRIAMTDYKYRMNEVKEEQAHFRSSSF